jgi:hypothetical protein
MEKIWYQDISKFITKDNYSVFFPSSSMSFAEQLNALMRLSLYFSIVMLLIKKDSNVFFIPIFMGLFTFTLWSVDEKNKKSDKELLGKVGLREEYISKELCQKPSKDNPFMNVLVSDYGHNPQRPRACRMEGKVKHEVKKHFDHNLYRDVDDIFHKKASDRQFYTTPSTTIPNDSVGYAKWLYGDQSSSSCKEGNGGRCYSNMYRTTHV